MKANTNNLKLIQNFKFNWQIKVNNRLKNKSIKIKYLDLDLKDLL